MGMPTAFAAANTRAPLIETPFHGAVLNHRHGKNVADGMIVRVAGQADAGEKVTVAFNFDPQICQETHIDGSLTYFDSKGIRHLKQMR